MKMSDTTRSSIHISNIVCVCRRVHPYVVFKKLSPDNYPVNCMDFMLVTSTVGKKKNKYRIHLAGKYNSRIVFVTFQRPSRDFSRNLLPAEGVRGREGHGRFYIFFFVFRFFIYERKSAPSPDENADTYSRRRICGQGARGPGTEPSDFRRRNAGFPPSIFFLFFYRSNFHFRKFFITSDKWPVHPVVTPTCPYRKIYYFIINFFFFHFNVSGARQLLWLLRAFLRARGRPAKTPPRKDDPRMRTPGSLDGHCAGHRPGRRRTRRCRPRREDGPTIGRPNCRTIVRLISVGRHIVQVRTDTPKASHKNLTSVVFFSSFLLSKRKTRDFFFHFTEISFGYCVFSFVIPLLCLRRCPYNIFMYKTNKCVLFFFFCFSPSFRSFFFFHRLEQYNLI